MRKLLVLFSVCLSLTSCISTEENAERHSKHHTVIEIDGCEYIFMDRSPVDGSMAIAHKGNCSNPIHYHTVIDSAEVTVGYLKSNGALKNITE